MEYRLNSLLDFSNLTLEPRYLSQGPGAFFFWFVIRARGDPVAMFQIACSTEHETQ